MNFSKFYSDLDKCGLARKPVAEMTAQEVESLLLLAAGSVHYWGEVLEWHRGICLEYCQQDRPCQAAAGYYHMVRKAYENAKKDEEFSLFQAGPILPDGALAHPVQGDPGADRALPTEQEPPRAAGSPSQPLREPWQGGPSGPRCPVFGLPQIDSPSGSLWIGASSNRNGIPGGGPHDRP